MKKDDLKNFPHLVRNISNWTEYTFYKGERGKRPLRFRTRPNAIRFEVTQSLYWVFKEIFVEDFYDIRRLLRHLPQDPVVIDVGANTGLFDLLILSKRKDAQVIAFEPLATNVGILQKTIDANPILQERLRVFQKAVTGAPVDSITLYMEDTSDNSEIASVFSDFDQRNTRSITVLAVTLSSVLREHEKVDLLKMDCEGSEYGILYDTPAEDLRRIRVMAIEVHQLDKERCNLDALDAYLESLGYETTVTPITTTTFYLEAHHAS
ncbi:MAG: FkbM family methyltransferase [Flaviaesturariibacter sp.]|nr:FkbM family methyltransferase [Flaviaesturariibacter sp.]